MKTSRSAALAFGLSLSAALLGGCLVFLPLSPRSPRIADNWWASYKVRVGFGHGTGVVLTEDGYILTAAHVVANDPYIDVAIQTAPRHEDSFRAEVVAADKRYDLAVLKVNGHHFDKYAVLAGDTDIRPGDLVYGIGYPLDIEESVGRGYVVKMNVNFSSAAGDREVINALLLDMFGAPGSSGEGVFAEADGKLVGLMIGVLPMATAKNEPPCVVRWAASVSDIRYFLRQHGVPYYE